MSELEKLKGQFKVAFDNGLKDVKFFVKDGVTLSDEELAKAVSDLEDRIKAGEMVEAVQLKNEKQIDNPFFS